MLSLVRFGVWFDLVGARFAVGFACVWYRLFVV